jgi:hypothetical protein
MRPHPCLLSFAAAVTARLSWMMTSANLVLVKPFQNTCSCFVFSSHPAECSFVDLSAVPTGPELLSLGPK